MHAKADKQPQQTVQVDPETHALLGKIQEALSERDELRRGTNKSQAVRWATLLAAKELKIKL